MLQSIAQPSPSRFEFATLAPWQDEPLMLPGLLGVAALVVAGVGWLYWRERNSLSTFAGTMLVVLRLAALAAVVTFALGPQLRDAQQQVRPSRVLLLVDDSQSMALSGEPVDSTQQSNRIDQVRQLLLDNGLLQRLRQQHEVCLAAASSPKSTLTYSQANPSADQAWDALGPEEQNALLDMIAPQAAETALGDALRQGTLAQATGTLAGVVLLSDGQSNAGENPKSVAKDLGDHSVPVHTLGFGSKVPPLNLAVREFTAPSRAYPNDPLKLVAKIDWQQAQGKMAVVTLRVVPEGGDSSTEKLLETQALGPLETEGSRTIEFVVTPEADGVYEYRVSIDLVEGESIATDNAAVVEVQVIDRTLKVLLAAGGPTRDYRFLRDQLARDDSASVDVYLQSAPLGISQDADQVLRELPAEVEALSTYDAIVAFDLDWAKVDASVIQSLAECVSQRGAGLIIEAGFVNTPRWIRSNSVPELLPMLPVRPEPPPLLLGSAVGAHSGPERLKLTRAGKELSALMLQPLADESRSVWEDQLPGFYLTAEVDRVSPAATIYAQTASPAESGKPRIVFAEQFFGSGRCFYIGSPEMWRLRMMDPAMLNSLFTQLLQHVSQGRLLAESGGASLAFERDAYNVGDTLILRAVTPAISQPAPTLLAQLQSPDGHRQNLQLTWDAAGGGYTARLRAVTEGAYQAIAESPATKEPLQAKTMVRVPAVERSKAVRNTRQLQAIAAASGGQYYNSATDALHGTQDQVSLAEALPSRSETITVYGAPNPEFASWVAQWLLGLLTGCLILEWAMRRMLSLA